MYWLFMYASKYIFSQTTIVKPQSETYETLANVWIFWRSVNKFALSTATGIYYVWKITIHREIFWLCEKITFHKYHY